MPHETPVTLWFTHEEASALRASAVRYGRSDEDQVRVWIADLLGEAIRQWHETQWDRRRRTVDANPGLAAQIDAAAGRPS